MIADLKTLLVIDDSSENINLYRNIFRQSGVRIVPVTSANIRQLGAIIADAKPSLILADDHTIRPHFAETIEILTTVGASVPNSLVTTSCASPMCEPFDYVIQKPFTAQMLRSVVSTVFRTTESA